MEILANKFLGAFSAFFETNRITTFVVLLCFSPFTAVTIPVVKLTLTLSVSLANFFASTLINNLALLLSIPASRIKIVSVRAGEFHVVPFEFLRICPFGVVYKIMFQERSVKSKSQKALYFKSITTRSPSSYPLHMLKTKRHFWDRNFRCFIKFSWPN